MILHRAAALSKRRPRRRCSGSRFTTCTISRPTVTASPGPSCLTREACGLLFPSRCTQDCSVSGKPNTPDCACRLLAASSSQPKFKPPPPMHGEEHALAACPLTGWLSTLMVGHRKASAEHPNRMMPPESDPPRPKKAPPPICSAIPSPKAMVVPIPKRAPPPLADAVPPPKFKLDG